MDKSFKIAKMNLIDILKATLMFYCMLLITLLGLYIIGGISKYNIGISALEIPSIIFIFVCGLNSFKENFYFSQGNSISRKSFITGIILSGIPIAILVGIVDLVINRIINLFAVVPNIYDTAYTVLFDHDTMINFWHPQNNFTTIIGIIFLFFAMYYFFYFLGIVINMIYFRCNTIMKIAISVIAGGIIFTALSTDVSNILYKGIKIIFGIDTKNIYLGICSFTLISVILVFIAYSLINEATIKEK